VAVFALDDDDAEVRINAEEGNGSIIATMVIHMQQHTRHLPNLLDNFNILLFKKPIIVMVKLVGSRFTRCCCCCCC
jgi:hypothetical protein